MVKNFNIYLVMFKHCFLLQAILNHAWHIMIMLIHFLIGSVMIYNNKLSEKADLEAVSKLTGVCPQSNVQFDFLTVRENLRLFAKIKGIQPHEVEKEVPVRYHPHLPWGNVPLNQCFQPFSDHNFLFHLSKAPILLIHSLLSSTGFPFMLLSPIDF